MKGLTRCGTSVCTPEVLDTETHLVSKGTSDGPRLLCRWLSPLEPDKSV